MKVRFLALFLLIISISALAQDNDQQDSLQFYELEEVILTATRSEKKSSSIPMPIETISRERIRKSGFRRLNELLQEQTGITETIDESGFRGIQMQGVSSQYIKVLIDGLPIVGRSSGNLDLSRLAIGNIRKIEIVKGPSSSLYGSDALGGVINIITEKPKKEKLNGDVNASFGTFNKAETNISFNQKKENIGYTFFVNALSSSGYDLNDELEGNTVDPYQNITLGNRLHFDISKRLKAKVKSRLYYQNIDINGNSEEWDANIITKVDHKWSESINTIYEMYYTSYQANQKVFDEVGNTLFDSNFDQQLYQPEIRTIWDIKEDQEIITGIGGRFQSLDRNLFKSSVNFNSQYVFSQYSVSPIEQLNIIVGARFDQHSEYESQLSPKISAGYHLTDDLMVKTSVGSGFKAPDFRQLYLDFTNSAVGYTVVGKRVESEVIDRLQENDQILSLIIDEDDLGEPLKAESSVGYNAGLKFDKKRYTIDLNFFRNDFSNLIDTRILARKNNGQNIFGYINRDEVYTQGIEVDANYQLNDNVDVSGGYQLLYAKDDNKKEAVERGEVFYRDPETLETKKIEQSEYFGLPNRSRHLANFKIYYKWIAKNAYVNLRINYRSKYALFDTNGNGLIDVYDDSFVNGFSTLNLSIGKTFLDDYELQLVGENILNNEQTGLLNLPGIRVTARLQYNF
jgi:outer membrane receptor for ferrienterochelin and colicins